MSTVDWTLAVAIYAALVSTGLLVLRIVEFRRDTGVAVVSTSFHPRTDVVPPTLAFHVTNSGAGAFTVHRLDLDCPGPASIVLRHDELIASGPCLPCRMDPMSSEVWHIDAEGLKALLRSNGWPYEVRGVATLATGKRVWESIHEYTSVH